MSFNTRQELQFLMDALNDALAAARDAKSKLDIATRANADATRRMEDAKRRLAIFWEDMARLSA